MLPKRTLLTLSLPRVRLSSDRNFCSSSICQSRNRHFKLVVVGGGAGGCSTAAKFARQMSPAQIAVIEPATIHYYQPMWTLVGGGMKTLEQSGKPMGTVLPKGIHWIQNRVTEFQPGENKLTTDAKETISYDFLVVALGIEMKYSQIKGLPAALETPGVCSNYSQLHVNKTYQALQKFQKGNAVFTFPNPPVKCAGAPQKIAYISDSYLRQHYADALWEVVKERDIQVNLRRNLIEVDSKHKIAILENLDNPGKTEKIEYEMLHVTPPMGAYDVMKNSPEGFCDALGFLSLNKGTLQHTKYPNVFGIGDCTNLPTIKTAAAVACQLGVLRSNLGSLMEKGEVGKGCYNGYTSCPLVTSYSKCMLAEFDYELQPCETFPINQAKERRIWFHMKKDALPFIYWNLMLKGYWDGPGPIKTAIHLGMK